MSELLVGMLSYSYIQDVRSDLAQSLAESFQAFYHMDSEFTQSVDLIQSKVRYYKLHIFDAWVLYSKYSKAIDFIFMFLAEQRM